MGFRRGTPQPFALGGSSRVPGGQELYLESDELLEEAIHAAVRRTTLDLKFCPMLMGSAYKNKGVQLLLDAVVRYLPSPLDMKNMALEVDDENTEVELKTDPTKPFVGYAFKIQDHPEAGQVTYMRVYQGKLAKGDQILNMMTEKRLGVKRLVRMHSNDVKDLPSAGAGDIVALAGVECDSGATFTDGKVECNISISIITSSIISSISIIILSY